MTTRQDKVNEFLRKEVTEIIYRELKDPRIGFVTITGVEVTSDLRHAKIYFSVMGSLEEKQSNLKLLKNAESFIRLTLRKRMHTKVIPQVHFVEDDSVERGSRIMELLEEIKSDDDK
ncbi:MAG: 30S ribosome-binding factor RbfA [Armatimonadota bacterium]